jgi:tetratricopeptide (TPR) repeat protein
MRIAARCDTRAVTWRPRDSWLAGALIALALLLYWSSLRNPPVFDDYQLLAARFQRLEAAPGFGLRWFSTVSFAWIHEAFGADWRWQRLANVLLHAATAVGLFFLLRRLFDLVLVVPSQNSRAIAWFGAFLFLLHPAAAYGVAYLIQRSIVMATLFCVLSLLLFVEGLVRRQIGWLIASVAAYFLAVYSKEHAVMLPAVAAALVVLLRRPALPDWRLLLPTFAMFAAIGLLVVIMAKGILGVQYEPFGDAAARRLTAADGGAPSSGGGGASYPISIVNQGYLFFRYLLVWLLPLPGWMSVDLRPAFPAQLFAWPQTAGFLAWLAWPALAAILLLRGGRAGLAGFAMLAPWLMALTEVATVRVQEIFVLYRSYLWMVWLPAALPALLAPLRARWALAALAIAAAALLLPLHGRLASFASNLALWDDAVRKIEDPGAPYVERSYRNRGVAYYHSRRFSEARRDFDRALELEPRSTEAWILRGSLFMRTSRNERALEDFGRALALAPNDADVLGRRCVVLMYLKRLDEALADCEMSVKLAPRVLDTRVSLGIVQALRGATGEAERHYRFALEIDPPSGIAHYQYGLLLRGLSRGAEARREFEAGCRGGISQACAAAVP